MVFAAIVARDEEWAVETGPVVLDVPGIGVVEQHRQVTAVAPPYVSFRLTYTFATDGLQLRSDSTLRFRTRDEVEQSPTVNGFTTFNVRDARDRPGMEYVFMARRSAA